MEEQRENLIEKVHHLIEIGTALSSEHNLKKLLNKILQSAIRFTSADGGSIYTMISDHMLRFELAISESLHFHYGNDANETSPFPDIPLFLPDGQPNNRVIVAHAANQGKLVNIKDAYHEDGFDFSGPRLFDEKTGYRTKSVLALPMKDHKGKVIGILQLINAYDPQTKKIISFSKEDEYLVESLASEAGVAISNQRLIFDLKNLFESFVRVIAKTIDQKSPFTGNHSRRVPIIAELLAREVNATKEGPLKDVRLSEEEIYELKMAALLHDCGKITTPAYLIAKKAKLEGIHDKMDHVATRIEVLQRDNQIQRLVKKLEWYESQFPDGAGVRQSIFQKFDEDYALRKNALNYDLQFLEKCNKAPELTEEMVHEIERIATEMWRFRENDIALLSADEVEDLSVRQGNLTERERKVIERHVVNTKSMLSEIPFPKELSKVAEIAGDHHERADGKGYPQGKKNKELSLSARILIIADIFEALSAPDRPYKEPMSLSRIYEILREKVRSGHLDGDLVEVFLTHKLGLKYGEKHLAPHQLDIS